jgi:hypothetical protein
LSPWQSLSAFWSSHVTDTQQKLLTHRIDLHSLSLTPLFLGNIGMVVVCCYSQGNMGKKKKKKKNNVFDHFVLSITNLNDSKISAVD